MQPDFFAVVAAVLAMVLLLDISALWLTGRQVPELASQLVFGVFGFYFGRAPGPPWVERVIRPARTVAVVEKKQRRHPAGELGVRVTRRRAEAPGETKGTRRAAPGRTPRRPQRGIVGGHADGRDRRATARRQRAA